MLSKADAIKAATGRAVAYVKGLKTNVADSKLKDIAAIRAKKQYETAEYVGRLAIAGKAQKVLNRVSAAVREGKLDADDLDRQKMKQLLGEALQDYKANLLMRNMLSAAYNEAYYEAGIDDENAEFFYYLTAGDSRVRPAHARWNKVLLKKTDALVKKIFPPNGHNCRCVMLAVSKQEAEQLKKAGEVNAKPAIKYGSYKDKLTGKTIRVLEGVDPGWQGLPSTQAEKLQEMLEREITRLQNAEL